MTLEDRRDFELLIENSVLKAVQPLMESISGLHQEIYDPDGDNGLKRRVGKVECKVESINLKLARWTGGGAAVGAIIGWILSLIVKLI